MGCYGQDWASYQSAVMPTDGLTYAFIKATEGTSYINPKHDAQVAYSRAQGLVVGHYHFARPGTVADQVSYFLRHAAPQSGDILCLDWEDTGVSGSDKDAWIRAAQAAMPQHQVVLYCNRDFWVNRDSTSFAGDGLWIADPGVRAGYPRIQAPWLFHQYAETGGIDRDYCTLSADALRAWAHAKEDDMTPAQEAKLDKVIALLEGPGNLTYRNADADAASMKATGKHIPDFYGYAVDTNAKVSKLAVGGVDLDALAAKVADLLSKRLQS